MGTPKKHATIVDLTQIQPLAELVLRAGDLAAKDARAVLVDAYEVDDDYDNVVGISVLFRSGANADALASEGRFPHSRLSISFVGKVMEELTDVGGELILFITPMPNLGLPDHHTLAIQRKGLIEPALSTDIADALLRSFLSVRNPYRRKRR